MVKVQVMGSVRTGERIYASTDDPGKAIPESHLPLGAFVIRNHTLLGMAMEGCKLRRYGEVNSVKCFVCIVLGINSFQLASEVENIMESIDADIKVAIGKSNETNCRRKSFLQYDVLLSSRSTILAMSKNRSKQHFIRFVNCLRNFHSLRVVLRIFIHLVRRVFFFFLFWFCFE